MTENNKRFKLVTPSHEGHKEYFIRDDLEKKEYDLFLDYSIEEFIDRVNKLWEQTKRFEKHNSDLMKENEKLKSELQRIYDVATINKTREIVDSIYDELLYETSEESEHKRNIILKCLEKLDDFRDDVE